MYEGSFGGSARLRGVPLLRDLACSPMQACQQRHPYINSQGGGGVGGPLALTVALPWGKCGRIDGCSGIGLARRVDIVARTLHYHSVSCLILL